MSAILSAPLSTHRLPPRTRPLVSIVIVNYRRWRETASLVRQLLEPPGLYRESVETLIIDNASPADRTAAELRSHSGLVVHRLPENRGFSAGVNAALRRSKGRWLLILNPDLRIPRDFLDQVCSAAKGFDEHFHDDMPVGVVGFQQRNPDGTPQPSVGFFPTLFLLLLGLLRPRAVRKYLRLTQHTLRQVPWVTGSCLLVRRDCLQQLGGFDEQFFLYYEDVDLCLRARDKGWAVCYEPAIQAVHLDPLQNRRLTAMMRAVTRHACLTYFRKHLYGWQFWCLAQLVRAEAWFRQSLAGLRRRPDEAAISHEIRGICRDLMRHRPTDARRRLESLLQQSRRQEASIQD